MRIRLALTLLAAIALVSRAEARSAKPDATLHLKEGSVAVGVGWSWGSGELTYRGKTHHFKVSGLTVNAVGATQVEARGYVYNLKRLEDFDGTYSAASAGGAAGPGKGIATMKNAADVRITLHMTDTGLQAQAGPEGVKFTLER